MWLRQALGLRAASRAILTPEMRFLQGAQREATAGFRRRLVAIVGVTVLLSVLVPFWIYVIGDSLFGPESDATIWRDGLAEQYREIGAQFRPEWVSAFAYTGLAAMATVNVALVVRSVQLSRSDVYEWGVWRDGVQQFLGFVAAVSTTAATLQWYGLEPDARGRALLVVAAALGTAVLAAWVPSDTNLARHNQLTELRARAAELDAARSHWREQLAGFARWRARPARLAAHWWRRYPRAASLTALLLIGAVLIAGFAYCADSLVSVTWEPDVGALQRWSLAIGVVLTSGLLVLCLVWVMVTRSLAEASLSPNPGVTGLVLTVELLVSFCWAALTALALAAAARIDIAGVLIVFLLVATVTVVVLSRLMWHSARRGLRSATGPVGLRPYVWGWAWFRATAVLARQHAQIDGRISLLEARADEASRLGLGEAPGSAG